MVLSGGERILTMRLAVLTQCQREPNSQTDRRKMLAYYQYCAVIYEWMRKWHRKITGLSEILNHDSRVAIHKWKTFNQRPENFMTIIWTAQKSSRWHTNKANIQANMQTCTTENNITAVQAWQPCPRSSRLWNSLPPELRQPELSYGQFRRSLKTFLFGQ